MPLERVYCSGVMNAVAQTTATILTVATKLRALLGDETSAKQWYNTADRQHIGNGDFSLLVCSDAIFVSNCERVARVPTGLSYAGIVAFVREWDARTAPVLPDGRWTESAIATLTEGPVKTWLSEVYTKRSGAYPLGISLYVEGGVVTRAAGNI